MMMPDITRREVVARLRAVAPRLPVVVCSGFASGADLDALCAEPLVHFVAKPYTSDELQRALAVAAARGAA
jgi:CheY-like chemotaxis protein